MKFDDLIVNYLGEFGTYQKLQFFLVCLPTLFTAMHALSWTFTAANVPNRCRLPNEEVDANYWLSNSTLIDVKANCDLDQHPTWVKCPYTECNIGGKKGCPNGHIFERSEISYSAIDRWDIVCERSFLKSIIQAMYYVGQMIGSMIFGYLGDRIGRKKVFFIAINLQIVSGLLMSIVPYWQLFAFLRIIVGSAHPGIFVIAVIIGMELAGPSKRKLSSVLSAIFFAFGQVILGVLAYFIRDYRLLQASIAIPSVIFILYWWIIPESARWLISKRRYEEADKILQRVARVNKTQLPSKWWEDIEITGGTSNEEKDVKLTENTEKVSLNSDPKLLKKKHHYNFLDLFRTPKLRKTSLAIFFCWPVVSMIYYGITMNPTSLGGNPYVNFILGGFMEIIIAVFVYFAVDKVGRKFLLICGFSASSLCLLSNFFIEGEGIINVCQFLIAKSAITGTYAVIYTFTPELFPTVIRNIAMGVCSMIARIGAITASFISMGLVDIYGKAVMIIPFSTLGLCAAVVLYFSLPETNGRALIETIEELEGEMKSYELQPLQQNQSSPKLS